MINRMAGRRTVAVVAALLLLVTAASDRTVRAQSQGQGATLAGTWVLATGPLKAFYTFHQGGTVTGTVSNAFGGPPPTGIGFATKTADEGIWARVGGQFESAVYRFNFALGSGNALNIVRLRSVYILDPDFESASGVFFVTQWTCPTPVTCPDPNVAAPDGPEFAPPGNTFSMTRVRLP
jgi:hypothetical protein